MQPFLSFCMKPGAERVRSWTRWIHSPLGPVVIARDELFTGRNPNLLLVEPHSLVITGRYATLDREAETWACALLLTQSQGVQITGLAEDGCIPYAASCRAAGLDAAIQRDRLLPVSCLLDHDLVIYTFYIICISRRIRI